MYSLCVQKQPSRGHNNRICRTLTTADGGRCAMNRLIGGVVECAS